MKKTSLLILGALLSAACSRIEIEPVEPGHPTVTLTATLESEATKTYLDGSNYVCWADGDKVWVNGAEYTAHVSGGTVTIPDVTAAEHYACVYPSTIVTEFKEGCKVKLSLPSSQTITYDSEGRQILSLPMAAYGDGSSALEFKNLCGLVSVTVSNTDKPSGLTPTRITLSTSDGAGEMTASLWGETWSPRNLSSNNYGDDWAIGASNIGSNSSSEKWTLNVSITGSPVIANGSSRKYYVTVPVIDEGTRSKLSVEMSGSLGSNTFLFSKKTTSSVKTIGRNQLGTIPISSTLCYEIKASGTDWNGSGTEADPYQISCVDHWNHMAQLVYDQDASITSDTYFMQVCDIDCGGSTIKPVGAYLYYNESSEAKPFISKYDGANHSLSNYALGSWAHDSYNDKYYGLFAYISSNAQIKNLTVRNDLSFAVHWNYSYIGGLIGYAYPATGIVLSNLTYEGNVTIDCYDRKTTAGGMAGEIWVETAENLTFSGKVNAKNLGLDNHLRLGGIAGFLYAGTSSNLQTMAGSEVKYTEEKDYGTPAYVTDLCLGGIAGELYRHSSDGPYVNRATLSCNSDFNMYVGGIAGAVTETTASPTWSWKNFINEGDITLVCDKNSIWVGGIIALVSASDSDILLENCSNSGNINATAEDKVRAGGCMGYLDKYILRVNKFRNTGAISAASVTDDAYCGGVVGIDDDGTLSQCTLAIFNSENRGSIAASSNFNTAAGGLIGYHDSDGYDGKPCIINCCNRGAVRAGGDDIYMGGLIGYCFNDDTTIGASFAVADLAYLECSYSDLYYGGISGTKYTHTSNWWKRVEGAISGATRLTPSCAYPDAGTHYQAAEDVAGLVSKLNGAWSSATSAVSGSVPSDYTPAQVTWKADGDYPALDF